MYTKEAIKNGQSRETGNIAYKTKENNTICVGHHYTQTNTNNVNKTWDILIINKASYTLIQWHYWNLFSWSYPDFSILIYTDICMSAFITYLLLRNLLNLIISNDHICKYFLEIKTDSTSLTSCSITVRVHNVNNRQ